MLLGSWCVHVCVCVCACTRALCAVEKIGGRCAHGFLVPMEGLQKEQELTCTLHSAAHCCAFPAHELPCAEPSAAAHGHAGHFTHACPSRAGAV